MTFNELKSQILNTGKQYDMELIERAYSLAEKSHDGQFRQSGEPYIVHPLCVASLLVELGLDNESICAGLLHDTVEDTDVTLEQIQKNFGDDITLLVDGVTKLGRIPFDSAEEQRAENIRKMLFAMSKDIRVMIVKLCDRLHNMQTLNAKSPEKQSEKALETMEIYAPIAHRLGMSKIQEELEDYALQFLDSVGYKEIMDYLTDNQGRNFIDGITQDIKIRLAENGLTDVEITNRIKSVYGIYRKLFIQNRSMEEIYDIYAIRVIVNTVTECYNVLGVIHDMYKPIPNRFKDYISTPKPNMYQSLHTTVVGHEGVPFEIQIRTFDMHYNAEYGVAAHWKYKEGINGKDKLEERLAWVRQLLESQQETDDSAQLLRDIKGDLLPEDVFIFTPKGDVINLPAGSTVIDFAYAIHTAVGHRMVGAKVNGRIVPLTYNVKTGEIIEVITGPKDKGPNRDWLNIVKTSEAKSKIRSWFKKERKEENITEGKQLFEKELRRNYINILGDKYEDFVNEIVKRQHLNSLEELYASLGYGGLLLSNIMPKVREEYQKLQLQNNNPVETFEIPEAGPTKSSGGVIVEGLDNCLVKFARCCNPLPGDEIVGFITRGHGVSVHKKDCQNIASEVEFQRLIHVEWAGNVKQTYRSSLEMTCNDRTGLIADITGQLSKMHIPIYSFSTRVVDGIAYINLTITVSGTTHLDAIVTRLRRIKNVEEINRTSS